MSVVGRFCLRCTSVLKTRLLLRRGRRMADAHGCNLLFGGRWVGISCWHRRIFGIALLKR